MLIEDAVSLHWVERLRVGCDREARGDRKAGMRNVAAQVPAVAEFVRSDCVHDLAEVCIGRAAFAVKVILFDKAPGRNWSVPWHQDTAIAVKERIERMGWMGWSQKGGVWHVHPPDEVLEGMLTLRVHLDDCPAENGALLALPGSHRTGRMGEAALEQWRARGVPVACAIRAGGVLAMKPLLIHASRRAEVPSRRRVLHIEMASEELGDGIEWAERWCRAGRGQAGR
jgi:ectoine hydroxylase-related dioxygenase (phytanoyl-CoA dioxygenase family)